MQRLRLALLLAALAGPAAAQDGATGVPVEAGTWEALAGDVILYFVDGRSLEEVGGPGFNPFGIDGEGLLFSLGSFFVSTNYEGRSVHEGEVSILPGFATPFDAFEPSAATPGIIPFAMLKQGECFAGYVAGHPVPDTTYAVDLGDEICHAAIVEEIVYARYAAAHPVRPDAEPDASPATVAGFDPAHPRDAELDVAVWAAYNAAYSLAIVDPEYRFIRDGDFDAVRAAIEAELLEENLAGIDVLQVTASADAYGCAPDGTTIVRVAFTGDALGLTLAAASSRRISTYVYDPAVSDELDIDYAHDCQTEGLGRIHTGGVR